MKKFTIAYNMKNVITLHKIPFLVLALILLISFVTSCGGSKQKYVTPKLPKSQIATIKNLSTKDLLGESKGTYVEEIDGKNVKGSDFFKNYPTEVYVLPGKHDLKLMWRGVTLTADLVLWLVAEPGKTYVAKGIYNGKTQRVHFFIIDEETGIEVGGVKGSDDEPTSK